MYCTLIDELGNIFIADEPQEHVYLFRDMADPNAKQFAGLKMVAIENLRDWLCERKKQGIRFACSYEGNSVKGIESINDLELQCDAFHCNGSSIG